ncbi:MAG: hypothetical protein RBU37_23165, partial [Myxococcota bacterium]|nr:hypothetical protein [Myxococcota bacterium]
MMSSPSPGHPSKLRVWPEARDCLCVLALAAFVTWSCERARPSTEAPQNGVVTEAQATETSAAPAPELVCELERERFVLLDGRWQRECLAEPIPRDSSIWTSDGHRVALLANAGCEDTEEQTVFVLRGEELSRVPLHLEQRIGRGGAITFLDDDLLLVPGESCEGPTLGLIVHRLNLATASVESHKHFSRSAELWPSIAKNGERIGIPLGFDDVFGMLTGTLPLPRAYCGCLHLWPVNPEYAMCCTPGFYQPDGSGVSVTWQSSTQMKELFEGRGLTWAQDLITGRMLYVAGIRTPDSKYYQGEFILSSHAWSLHEYQPARRLPIPPVMGDGVQLLFDADRGQMILLDPASTRSWLLEKDYRR